MEDTVGKELDDCSLRQKCFMKVERECMGSGARSMENTVFGYTLDSLLTYSNLTLAPFILLKSCYLFAENAFYLVGSRINALWSVWEDLLNVSIWISASLKTKGNDYIFRHVWSPFVSETVYLKGLRNLWSEKHKCMWGWFACFDLIYVCTNV